MLRWNLSTRRAALLPPLTCCKLRKRGSLYDPDEAALLHRLRHYPPNLLLLLSLRKRTRKNDQIRAISFFFLFRLFSRTHTTFQSSLNMLFNTLMGYR